MLQLKQGEKIAIVSLSQGILGEEFCHHQLELGIKRLKEFGLKPIVMPHALDGIEKLAKHPERRAADLISAFKDPDIKAILCAIGGDDTFKLTPYIFDESAKQIIQDNPKLFLGYSDSTINHLMLYQLGVPSFYGMSFLTCFSELGREMLPYSKASFDHLFSGQPFIYQSSPVWYEERTDFNSNKVGTKRVSHNELVGYKQLQGSKIFAGHLLGGCVESLFELITGNRYIEEKEINEQYQLMPRRNEWEGAVIFLETSEEKPKPEHFKKMIVTLLNYGIFEKAAGVLLGKAQDEVFNDEYGEILKEVLPDELSIVTNLNVGHAYPKIIMQCGSPTHVDMIKKTIKIDRL